MEKKLKNLFDYQKFESNPARQSVIDSVHRRYGARMLTDEELGLITAAGAPEVGRKLPEADDKLK